VEAKEKFVFPLSILYKPFSFIVILYGTVCGLLVRTFLGGVDVPYLEFIVIPVKEAHRFCNEFLY
jgi:hypothetical protein